ncbi:hypothetical protein C1646_665300 [Rhizophagus diaphanus]|nr:hypothetical protein C1646_665300 [Rhizophagus diaphanus] [Rhizophagus sp. MUCL 43196]
MAGKTTLALLFENSLLNSDKVKKGLRRVFHISLMWLDNKEDDEWTFAEGFESLINMTWFKFLNSCNGETLLIIIDEAQKMCTPINGNEPLHSGLRPGLAAYIMDKIYD